MSWGLPFWVGLTLILVLIAYREYRWYRYRQRLRRFGDSRMLFVDSSSRIPCSCGTGLLCELHPGVGKMPF